MTANLKVLIGKLNPLCKNAAAEAVNLCVARGQYEVDLEHLFIALLGKQESDFHYLVRHYGINSAALEDDLDHEIEGFRTGNGRTPVFSTRVSTLFEHAWLIASIDSHCTAIRSAHLLLALLTEPGVAQYAIRSSRHFSTFPLDELKHKLDDIVRDFPESLSTSPATSLSAGTSVHDTDSAGTRKRGTPSLDKYTDNLTQRARDGRIDPVIGREKEIGLMIDILMRRRQNNPILTGEAGVGKTAVVEGLALRLADGDVPTVLQDVELHVLDLGLLQAGASVKGEFENRLRGVIDEVKGSPHPIILFIDEAHTLIGAGGQAGQNDAANLLKPALARGELRTIAATTWSEYKKYFEKDSALARRFQAIKVEEPSEPVACAMLRGLSLRMEDHFKVRILDDAITQAVRLSSRYITGRQLPDKAISVLDTACAKVALARDAAPAALIEARSRIAAMEEEISMVEREAAIEAPEPDRLEFLHAGRERERERLAELERRWAREKELVARLTGLRERLEDSTIGRENGCVSNSDINAFAPSRSDEAALSTNIYSLDSAPTRGEVARNGHRKEILAEYSKVLVELKGGQDETLIVPFCVDAQMIADVISSWTGIPVGKMLKDEIATVLNVRDLLEARVIGQTHALEQIARRIKTARANIEDPGKPKGVFLFVGPSGVGKTETALALADILYGGERNLITINMSEYQEAHSVSGLKGSPPGYVGFGEGGVLTEAVRRKPHSVVLLDEIEKAHPDVLELFFQVFDKGVMEDAEGREIDFKNTIIILTSNVGSQAIMQACLNKPAEELPSQDELEEQLRPSLYKNFKAAFLGRMRIVPFYPLSDEVLSTVIKLKLSRISERLTRNHKLSLSFGKEFVEAILARCVEVDSGARNIDNILNGTLLPDIAGMLLKAMAEGTAIKSIRVGVAKSGKFTYRLA
ncbi:type VI secretion system ATPase TssH [Noviherbaspirillum aerium]|uniref:type VI secretion system ATPase TssH n=1 Tax=Noviherbaspirillum aerium TaxID=2588497 RepID=UPI00124BD08B|nr:type VI secretion system ATPase TssH [Noviherbaspirillum aerium]